MGLKAIMVPFGGDGDEDGALRTAFELARAHNAHVEVWHVTPSPYNMSTAFYPAPGLEPIYSEELLMELKRSYAESGDNALYKFSRIAHEMDIDTIDDGAIPDHASASFHHATGNADEIIALRSRLCDISVISRATSEGNAFFHDIIYSALFDSARPILLIPAGKSLNVSDAKVIIAWNNSLEASRALSFSLPLLAHSKVWVWDGNRENRRPVSGESDLLRYLRLHGAEAEELFPNAATPESLLMSAKRLDASMIVMGAYSHSRFRETILGGMTDFMLKNANIPVFMAH